jgi:hypothetical protein
MIDDWPPAALASAHWLLPCRLADRPIGVVTRGDHPIVVSESGPLGG